MVERVDTRVDYRCAWRTRHDAAAAVLHRGGPIRSRSACGVRLAFVPRPFCGLTTNIGTGRVADFRRCHNNDRVMVLRDVFADRQLLRRAPSAHEHPHGGGRVSSAPGILAASGFSDAGYPVVPLIYIVVILGFLVSAVIFNPYETFIGAALTATAVPAYLWTRRGSR